MLFVAATALVAISLLLSGYMLYERFQDGKRAREVLVTTNRHQNEALRTFICFFEQTALANKKITPAQRERAVRFFTQALAKIHALPCP